MIFDPAPFDISKYGEWALVTGCTDGIGKEYCLQMADQRCSKFILIGRNSTKLDNLEDEIRKRSKDTPTIEKKIIDFANFNDYDGLQNYLQDKSNFEYNAPVLWFVIRVKFIHQIRQIFS